MMFRFAYPLFLAALTVVGGWIYYLEWKKPVSLTYSMTSSLAKLTGRGSRVWGRIPMGLRALCLVLLIVAAARPQLYNISKEIKSRGVDIMLCIDTSGSMRALDFTLNETSVTRLTAVKKVVSDFIKKREFDRIGLVVFGDDAFTQSPLTLDKGLLLGLVEKMEIGMAGDRTAIGTALAIGGKRLKNLKAKAKILILLTDGRNNTGRISPKEAAEAVSALGVKIYTIGVGSMGLAPFKVKDFFGTRIVHQRVDLDEKTLKSIAKIGRGKYYRAADSDQLSEIYALIDREEKTEVKVKEFFHFRELYPYLLIPALLILGLEILLRTTVLRVIP